MGLIAWFRRQRQQSQAHIDAFSAARQLEPDGLTRLQHMALSAVAQYVAPGHFSRVAMRKGSGVYLVARVGGSGSEIYIYPNEASIVGQKPDGCFFEEWDYRTPEELAAALAKECAVRVAKQAGVDSV